MYTKTAMLQTLNNPIKFNTRTIQVILMRSPGYRNKLSFKEITFSVHCISLYKEPFINESENIIIQRYIYSNILI